MRNAYGGPEIRRSAALTAVGDTADGTRRSTGDTPNMGSSAGTGEALAWVIASDAPSTSPDHGYTSGAHGEPWSTHTCGLNIVNQNTAATSLIAWTSSSTWADVVNFGLPRGPPHRGIEPHSAL